MLIFDNFVDRRILISERKIGPLAGRFTFPGGKLKSGETALRCAARETREETGLIISTENIISVAVKPYRLATKSGLSMLHIFYCFYDEACNDKLVQDAESKQGEWQWLSIAEVLTLITFGLFHPPALTSWIFEVIDDLKYLKVDAEYEQDAELESYLYARDNPTLVNRVPARALVPKELRPILGY